MDMTLNFDEIVKTLKNHFQSVSVTTMTNDICRPRYCCQEYVSFLDTT